MKTVLVIQITAMCLILTLFSIFTIDTVSVKKAEMQQIVACDITDIVDKYFDKEIDGSELRERAQSAIYASAHSKIAKLDILIDYADASKGVLSITIEQTYQQPNGSFRSLSTRKVFIRETNVEGAAASYLFTRTISEEYYKDANGLLVSEADGGLKSDSIWRTAEYVAILDSVFTK